MLADSITDTVPSFQYQIFYLTHHITKNDIFFIILVLQLNKELHHQLHNNDDCDQRQNLNRLCHKAPTTLPCTGSFPLPVNYETCKCSKSSKKGSSGLPGSWNGWKPYRLKSSTWFTWLKVRLNYIKCDMI